MKTKIKKVIDDTQGVLSLIFIGILFILIHLIINN